MEISEVVERYVIILSRIGFYRTEQRAEVQRKIYLTARILNEVVDALTKDGQTDEFNSDVSVSKEPCYLKFLMLKRIFLLYVC